jgi:hypothetical protein
MCCQVFLYLFLLNNLFITSTLIVGAGAVITTLTGVSIKASCILIPLGIVIYCVAGGLKASLQGLVGHETSGGVLKDTLPMFDRSPSGTACKYSGGHRLLHAVGK